eukprot:TRINITY_DN73925_c0_g1_i1.p1 TRINITY_DN73925_c0_g1~~TRINITY_DN73925_c0_g1_i1.p1  ORF type:complete len:380 (-),score=51.64 TRINITY_DN73925_c0_g1_i1:143-1186(-)
MHASRASTGTSPIAGGGDADPVVQPPVLQAAISATADALDHGWAEAQPPKAKGVVSNGGLNGGRQQRQVARSWSFGRQTCRPPERSASHTAAARVHRDATLQLCSSSNITESVPSQNSVARGLGRRPHSATVALGRGTHLGRTQSAPSSTSGPETTALAKNSSLNAYRSKAIGLQVRLQEQLAHLERTTVRFGQRPAASSTVNKQQQDLTAAHLRIYSEIFDSVIKCNSSFAPALREVKRVYDTCVEPWQPFKPVPSRETTIDTGDTCDVESGKLADLEAENRRLKDLVGQLHRERLQRKKTGLIQAPQKPPRLAGEAATVSANPSKSQRPWSALQVTRGGVRVAIV